MALALSTARKSEHARWKLGSVIWRGGSVLSKGVNQIKNDPAVLETEKYYHCTVHAEVAALRSAKRPIGAKLFVARVTKSGGVGLAKPCDRCMREIAAHGIKKVYYTLDGGGWDYFRVDV